MTIPSNLYAEKVYSEHPIATWHLDDQADYITLILNNKRSFISSYPWTGSSNISIKDPETDGDIELISPLPFDSENAGLSYCRITDASISATITSGDLQYFSSLNQDLKTFSVGCWVYTTSSLLQKISIGYTYVGGTPVYNEFITSTKNKWFFISGTFSIPEEVDENDYLQIIVKIDADNSSANENDYEFYFNGFTAGQRCEEYHAESLGNEVVDISNYDINIFVDGGVPASAYGFSNKDGFYLVDNLSLVAKSGSIPLAYGASNSIKLIPHEELITTRRWSSVNDEAWQYWKDEKTWSTLLNLNFAEQIISAKPSIIFPGCGFLNEIGRNQEYTVEFWISVDSNAKSPRRIFGPIASTDGLYVDNGFLTLKIDDNFVSHYVGEWVRPMLVTIKIVKDQASLFVNGEDVGEISFSTNKLILPSITSEDNLSNDWLGFYTYKDDVVDPMFLGSFSIFPYSMSSLVIKSHYVYGQGVPTTPEVIDSYYGGTCIDIDYSVSKYNNNKSYPTNLSWLDADLDNIIVNNNIISLPKYSLPTFNIGTKTLKNLEDDSFLIQDDGELFFSLNPNSTWDEIDSSIYFNNFQFIQNPINCIYGVFEFTDSDADQVLLHIFKDSTNYFQIKRNANESTINYIFSYNGTSSVVDTVGIPVAEFAAGINITSLLENNSILGLKEFFSNISTLKMILGNGYADNKFTGKIYSFGIATTKNTYEIEDHFAENGIAIKTSYSSLLSHISSYTLTPFKEYGKFYLDISVAGYWRDYVPLSTLTSQVYDSNNNIVNDLDYIQFNIDYPAPSDYSNLQETYWTDSSLLNEYDTENHDVRSYVAFDYITNNNSKLDNEYTVVNSKFSKILDLNTQDWTNKKFEVVDNYLIYPDKTTNIETLSMILFVNFKIKGILKKNIFLRKLQLSAKSLNYSSNNPIGTKYGIDVYPERKIGFYVDNKAKTYVSIDKENTPYLYLTRKSGIELKNGLQDQDRSITIPVSSENISYYSVSAMQIFARCDLYAFPENPVKIFEVNHKFDSIDFYIKADLEAPDRGLIFAKLRSTDSEITSLTYYLNGKVVRSPVVNIQEWFVLGISFENDLIFNYYAGSVKLRYLMTFNTISVYQGTTLQVIQRLVTRNWQEIKDEGPTWNDWYTAGNWNNVLIRSKNSKYIVDPSNVYNSYIGTNKIIVDDFDNSFGINTENITVYQDATWQNYVITPA